MAERLKKLINELKHIIYFVSLYAQILLASTIPNSHWIQTQNFLQLMVTRFLIAIHKQKEEVVVTTWR